MSKDNHPYYDCLCLASRRLARVVTQIYDEALGESGLRITQFSVLTALGQGRGEAPRLSAISAALDMEPSSLTRSLHPLVRRGLVEILPGRDRRERRGRLTAEGERVLERAHARWREVQERISREIGEDDFRTLLSLLHQGRERITDATGSANEEQ